ncbi:MAG: YfhO family protein [Ignavibacteria bacterium]|nr:YfhO family protein [Ignavibacteria bacterium]
MSKVKKNSKVTAPAKENFFTKFNLDNYIPAKYQVPALIIVIILLFLIFLNPLYFGDKIFQSGDIITMESAQPYRAQEREGFSLWFPYIFCGMPAYAISTEATWFNFIYVGFTSVRNFFASLFATEYTMWSFYLIILGVTSFFFMKFLTKNNLVSLFTALATAFSTGLIVFLFIGHVTKLTSLCMYPLLFLMLLRMQEKIRLIDFFILVVALQLFIQGFHVQIIFYTLFAIAIYFIYFFIRSTIKKENELRNNILKSAAVFILASVIAVLIQSDSLTQVYEYTQYSTRGTESIIDKAGETGADYYKYHTDWSFSPEEVLTFVVPSFYGFGNSTYKGPLTNNQPVEVNTYFGQMPFVDVAMYMGVLIFFLALYGIFTRWKEPLVQFLTILSGIALLISFGKNFPVLFDLMFYNFPYFDKFRVPSMALVLVQLSMPVLAGFGLMGILSLRNEKNIKYTKTLKNFALGFTVILIFSLLLSSSISDWFITRVNDYAAGIQASRPQFAQQFMALAEYSAEMFTTDLLLAFGFSTIVFWLAYFYVTNKVSADFLVFSVIVLTIIDLWRIDARGAKYIDSPDIKNIFTEPAYITAIKNQNDKEPFRMFNLKQDNSYGSIGYNSNFNAYFLVEDFYGYSGIKPRAFQDLMDVAGPANTSMWRMLNVKYIVADLPAGKASNFFPANYLTLIDSSAGNFTYLFNDYLPRAYFVNSVEKKSNIEFLNLLKASAFDPKEKAFVPDVDIKVDPLDSTSYSRVTNYKEDYIKVEANASGNNLLFIGNTYHHGWKATIDGEETETYLVNHGYIGVIVPKGNHIVEVRYAPESFYISKNIALVLSSLVVVGLFISVFREVKKKRIKKD